MLVDVPISTIGLMATDLSPNTDLSTDKMRM